MEIEPNVEKNDKGFMKKKILGFPIVIFIVLGIVMVVAVTLTYLAYTHSFQKTINVYNNGHGVQYVGVTGEGDISSTTLNCDDTEGECIVSSGNITLSNSDTIAHNCTITTTGDDVNVTYVMTDGQSNSQPTVIEVPASGSVEFNIRYSSSVEGSHLTTTNINCP